MRVTNSMISQNVLRNMGKNMEKLDEAYTRMSSGKNIQAPSDDPVCAVNILKNKTNVSQIEQYQSNADAALSWMNITEQSMSDLEDVVQRTRELIVKASNETLSEEDRNMIKEEIMQLEKSAIEIGNQTYAGRHIFAGYDTDEPPFEIGENDAVTYKGGYLCASGPFPGGSSDEECIKLYGERVDSLYDDSGSEDIMYNMSLSSEVKVNVEGADVFGSGVYGLFQTFKKLEMALDGETSIKTVTADESTSELTVVEEELVISKLLSDVDEDIERISVARADLGSRINYVELSQQKLANEYNIYKELLSKNEDADMAKASIDYSTAQYTYEASLSVGSKVIQPSLLDFIG